MISELLRFSRGRDNISDKRMLRNNCDIINLLVHNGLKWTTKQMLFGGNNVEESRDKFLTSEEKLNEKDLNIKQLQSEKDELNIELARLKKKLQAQENGQESVEKRILDSRYIVKAQHPNHSNGIMWDITSLPFYNLANFKLKVVWKKVNEDLIKKNQIIVDIKLISSSDTGNKLISLESNVDGKLFILEDDKVKDGQIIAVVSDPADNIKDIKKWLEVDA